MLIVLARQHSSAKDCYFLTLIWWFLGVLQKTSPWKQYSPSFIAWVLKWMFWSKKCDSLSWSNYQLSDGKSCPVAGARDTLSLTQYFTSSTASWKYLFLGARGHTDNSYWSFLYFMYVFLLCIFATSRFLLMFLTIQGVTCLQGHPLYVPSAMTRRREFIFSFLTL